jgi:hypothetical protein
VPGVPGGASSPGAIMSLPCCWATGLVISGLRPSANSGSARLDAAAPRASRFGSVDDAAGTAALRAPAPTVAPGARARWADVHARPGRPGTGVFAADATDHLGLGPDQCSAAHPSGRPSSSHSESARLLMRS